MEDCFKVYDRDKHKKYLYYHYVTHHYAPLFSSSTSLVEVLTFNFSHLALTTFTEYHYQSKNNENGMKKALGT